MAEIYWIANASSGCLGVAARPRAGDWLEDEAKAWKLAGVSTVVSLLTEPEIGELGLKGEQAACAFAGIEDVSSQYRTWECQQRARKHCD